MQYDDRSFFRTMAAICCTIVFSSAVLLSAVGPARAGELHTAQISAHLPR